MRLVPNFLLRAQAMLGRLGLASEAAHAVHACVPEPAGDAWPLGELVMLSILEPDARISEDYEKFPTGGVGHRRLGHTSILDFTGAGIDLTVTGDGRQIVFTGGCQTIDLDELGLSSCVPTPVVIGPVDRIRYVSERRGKHEDYEHMCGYQFGSDFSELPVLVYDAIEKRMALVGGVYRVGRQQGIVC